MLHIIAAANYACSNRETDSTGKSSRCGSATREKTARDEIRAGIAIRATRSGSRLERHVRRITLSQLLMRGFGRFEIALSAGMVRLLLENASGDLPRLLEEVEGGLQFALP